MSDREKTIAGLEYCIGSDDGNCPIDCPFYDECFSINGSNPFVPALRAALQVLKEPHDIDIVRCKDCIYHHYDSDRIPYCELIDYGYGWHDNDFCSRGKRR